jgi:hypothetical protein
MRKLFRRQSAEFQHDEQAISDSPVPLGVEIRRNLKAKGEGIVGTEADWAAATQLGYDHELAIARAEAALRMALAEEVIVPPPNEPIV